MKIMSGSNTFKKSALSIILEQIRGTSAEEKRKQEEEEKRKQEEEEEFWGRPATEGHQEEEKRKQEEEEKRRQEEEEKKKTDLISTYSQVAEKGLIKAINKFQTKYEYEMWCVIGDELEYFISDAETEYNILTGIIKKNGIVVGLPDMKYIFKRAYLEKEYVKLDFIKKSSKYGIVDYFILMWQFYDSYNKDYDLKLIKGALKSQDLSLDLDNLEPLGEFQDGMIKTCELYNQYLRCATASEELDNFALYSKKMWDDLGSQYLSEDNVFMRAILFFIKFRELGYLTTNREFNTQEIEKSLSNMKETIFSRTEKEWLSDTEEDGDSLTIDDIDQMDGYSFEGFLVHLYVEMGYMVKHTKLSGDQGADLIISKNGESFVVQAKKHSNKINNKAVQEVTAAIKYYHTDGGIVVTNSEFTNSAILLAYSNDISLINREKLMHLIEKYPVKKEA